MEENMKKSLTIEEAGVVAVGMLENLPDTLTAQEQSFFIAGFQEAVKYLEDAEDPKEASTLKAGDVVTLLTSYCDKPNCTDNRPCKECLMESNQFILTTDCRGTYLKTVGDE